MSPLEGQAAPRPAALLLVTPPDGRLVRRALEREGFTVEATSSPAAEAAPPAGRYGVIVLDLALPGIDGPALLRGWRGGGVGASILALADRPGARGRARGLDLGADDCLDRPFDRSELLARLRALARRARSRPGGALRVFDLEIDTDAHVVRRAGQLIHLTAHEYALLELLVRRRGQVVCRTSIWGHLSGGPDALAPSNVIDVLVSGLRRKIDKGFDPPLLLTRWGEGYLLRGDG
jgi:DNA-binding response OmpR family regulator